MDKRNFGRFCIQFNVTDGRNLQVIELLEAQGRRKAQYIAEAVLHYANCSETPKIHTQADTASIRLMVEVIVRKYLKISNPHPAADEDSAVNVQQELRSDSSIIPALEEMFDADLLASMRESMSSLREVD